MKRKQSVRWAMKYEFAKWWTDSGRWKARQWYLDAVTEEAFRVGYRAGRKSKA